MSRFNVRWGLNEHAVSAPAKGDGAPDYAVARILSRHNGIGTWRLDVPSTHINWSKKTFDIYGLPFVNAPVPLKTVMEHFIKADRKTAAQMLMDAIEQKCGFHYILRIIDGQGRLRFVECYGDVELEKDGAVRTVVGSIRDVTDLQKQEAYAVSRTMILKTLMQRVPAAVAILDKDMHYIAVSDYWAKGHGAPNAHYLNGKSHYEIQKHVITQEMKADHQKVLKGIPLERERAIMTDSNGNAIAQKTVLTPWYSAPNEIGGMIIMLSQVDLAHTFEDSGEDKPTRDEFKALLAEIA